MKEVDVRNLLQRFAKGDFQAFEEFFHAQKTPLFSYLQSLTGNRDLAEEAFQNLFHSLLRSLDSLLASRDFEAYLFTIARNEAGKVLRKKNREEQATQKAGRDLSLQGWFLSDSGSARWTSDDLEKAFRSLPADQQSVLGLKIYDDKTFEDIGRLLDISANTAASRYRLGLEKLKESLGHVK